jgi:hypothetical protein
MTNALSLRGHRVESTTWDYTGSSLRREVIVFQDDGVADPMTFPSQVDVVFPSLCACPGMSAEGTSYGKYS